MLITLLSTLAFAGDDLPDVNANLFRPSIDSESTLWTDDSTMSEDGYLSARTFGQYVRSPFVYTWADGSTDRLVSDIMQLDAIGGYTFQGTRFGLDLPIFVFATSSLEETRPGLGDLSLDIKRTLFNRDTRPIGFAIGGRMSLPTNTMKIPVAADGLSWEVSGIADQKYGDLLIAGNFGVRSVPLASLETDDNAWSDQIFFRAGAGYQINESTGLSAELAGQTAMDLISNTTGSPLELMVGGWRRWTDSLVFKGGASTGLTEAMGSPTARLLFGVSYQPQRAPDRDLDGIADISDRCPSVPEDIDGFEDDDGCIDTSSEVTIKALAAGEAPRGAVTTSLVGNGVNIVEQGEYFTRELHQGTYTLSVISAHYSPVVREVIVNQAGRMTLVTNLTTATGTLTLTIVNENGKAMPSALVSIGGGEPLPLNSLAGHLPPGEHSLTVTVGGYKEASITVHIHSGKETNKTIHMVPVDVVDS